MNKSTFVILGALFTATCFAEGTQNSYYAEGQKNTRESHDYISDVDLVKKIKEKLSPGWFTDGFPGVVIQSYNGDIQLSGTVQTTEDKNKVEKLAQEVRGVKSIDNKIVIQQLPATDKNRDNARLNTTPAPSRSDNQPQYGESYRSQGR